MPSLGLAANIYQEPNMLPGLLENASRMFDDIYLIFAGPSAGPRDDEGIAIAEKWGARIGHGTIDDGFGALRTRLIQESTTEWVLISDADERVFSTLPILECVGTESYPEVANPKLSVGVLEPAFSQRDRLREMLEGADESVDAIRFVRRHWFDFGMHRPTQNWYLKEDWQLRLMRRRPWIGYDPNIRMHERALDSRTGGDPNYITADPKYGPWYDHFHMPAKAMEPEQRRFDISVYDALSVDGHEAKLKEIYQK